MLELSRVQSAMGPPSSGAQRLIVIMATKVYGECIDVEPVRTYINTRFPTRKISSGSTLHPTMHIKHQGQISCPMVCDTWAFALL